MDDLVTEQEEKRKSELDALQSQINPHFLYNALDSVVWLIEGERYRDAVYTVKELASLMRVSISHGRSVITVSDEIRHAKSYMNIQNIRYRNSFDVEFDIDEDIMEACTVKLIVQPLLENAIYYGIKGMEDDAEIRIRGYKKDGDVYIEVSDNGIGMPEDQVRVLLDKKLSEEYRREHESSGMRHGNGVGLINVDMRIRLLFGEDYGLIIESEPDEGTTMSIHIPYIEYSDEIEQRLKKR
jgi:two-component system sensor histidine kinase YesM